MQISLNQAELEVGIKMFIQSRGIDLNGRSTSMDFTNTRKGNIGITVDVDLGEDSVYVPEHVATPYAVPSAVTLTPNRNGGFSAKRTPSVHLDEASVSVNQSAPQPQEEATNQTDSTPMPDFSGDDEEAFSAPNETPTKDEDTGVEASEDDSDETPDVEMTWYHKPETQEIWQEPETNRRKGIYRVSESTAQTLQKKYDAMDEEADTADEQPESPAEPEAKEDVKATETEQASDGEEEEDDGATFDPFAGNLNEKPEPLKQAAPNPFASMETEDKRDSQTNDEGVSNIFAT